LVYESPLQTARVSRRADDQSAFALAADPEALDDEHGTRRKSVTVKYGLVQRPELFVANPDHKAQSSSDS